ncbi:MAG: Ig-like domain-containing protein [Syntrophomonadaceae bacterium]|nr:Ig-like domain-containing protein [Syntrophomonadaceae bacterium]
MAEEGQKPLNFLRSIPAKGAAGVSTRLKSIKLLFDKNVVNDSVWANNRKQIKMWAGTQKIPARFTVTRIKDTVDFSERNNIFIKPRGNLLPFTKYTIAILPELTSKNGQTLGKTVVITFTTGKKSTTPVIPVQE